MKNPIELSVVVPIFNEQEVIQELFHRLTQALKQLTGDYEIIFVDDGSRDKSWEFLRTCKDQDPQRVKVVGLARNFGHQLAITAGLRVAGGQATVVIDADLQDPPEVISEFYRKWKDGYEIIYGVRIERKGESFFKKATAKLFYKIIRLLTGMDIPENVGDFYLLGRPALDAINRMEERHRFIRGLVAWIGFKRKGVGYIREARYAGKTKYSFWKMVKFSFDAMTSFSFAPLRVISFIGLCISVIAFFGILWIIYLKIFMTATTALGWASIMVAVLFIGGIQLLALGIIGEYLARIGDDVKRRPLYIVKEYLD